MPSIAHFVTKGGSDGGICTGNNSSAPERKLPSTARSAHWLSLYCAVPHRCWHFYVRFDGVCFLSKFHKSFSVLPRTSPEFVGVDNYVRAFSEPAFRISLANAFWYFLIVTTFQTIGAILLAVLLNTKLQGIRFFRTLLYSPSVASSVVIALIFLWLYQRRARQ
jgi:ABC-type sugar transport system permease subunit